MPGPILKDAALLASQCSMAAGPPMLAHFLSDYAYCNQFTLTFLYRTKSSYHKCQKSGMKTELSQHHPPPPRPTRCPQGRASLPQNLALHPAHSCSPTARSLPHASHGRAAALGAQCSRFHHYLPTRGNSTAVFYNMNFPHHMEMA